MGEEGQGLGIVEDGGMGLGRDSEEDVVGQRSGEMLGQRMMLGKNGRGWK